MKNLVFSQDDILLALLDSISDSFTRASIVKSLLSAKLKRLKSDKKFELNSFETKYGSIGDISENFSKFTQKKQKACNNKIKKVNTLVKQIDTLTKYYNELSETSFGNESLDKLESNIIKVFKWEKPSFYEDLFKRSET